MGVSPVCSPWGELPYSDGERGVERRLFDAVRRGRKPFPVMMSKMRICSVFENLKNFELVVQTKWSESRRFKC